MSVKMYYTEKIILSNVKGAHIWISSKWLELFFWHPVNNLVADAKSSHLWAAAQPTAVTNNDANDDKHD